MAATVTVVGPSSSGFLRVSPGGGTAAATVNFASGVDANRFVIAPVDASGRIDLKMFSATADVVVDVAGYFTDPDAAAGDTYFPVAPADRLADTRPGSAQGLCPTALCATPGAGSSFKVAAAGRAGLPADGLSAAVISVTVLDPTHDGFLRVAPVSGGASATVQYLAGETVNDVVIAPVNADGTISFYTTRSADVVIDVTGYMLAPGVDAPGGVLQTTAPSRAIDTRNGTGTCSPSPCARFSGTAGTPVTMDTTIPDGATAVVGFVTVINPSANGFLRINPTGTGGGSTGNTGAATINYNASQNRSSLVMAPVDPTGAITVGTNATVDLVFDVTGYYTPGSDHWTYTYDSTSLRSTKTGPDDTTTEFAWSATGGLPLLLGQHDPNGDDTWITYGPGGQPLSQINPNNTVTWLHHDQIGSIRLTTNQTGAVTSTGAWDPYGNPTETTGTKPLLGYTGQYSDAETGLTYLRARYYDPTTNQFLTQDPLVATTHEPYGYTGNNPLNASDPSGLAKCGRSWTSPGDWVDCGAKAGGAAVQEVEDTAEEVTTSVKNDPLSALHSLTAYTIARASGASCSVRDDAIECVGAPSPINGNPYTVGNVVMNSSNSAMEDPLWKHEMAHVRQWLALGPLFPSVWGANLALYGECNMLEGSAGFDDGNYHQCDGLGRGFLQGLFGGQPKRIVQMGFQCS